MTQLIDTFPTHFFIEMCYGRKNEYGFIYEQKLTSDRFFKLCESYGIFDGCQELTEEILENLYIAINRDIKNYMFNPKNNSFAKTILLKITDYGYNFYSGYESKFKDNKFDPLVICIDNSAISDNASKPAIMHELTHAYQEYRHFLNNTDGLVKQAQRLGYSKNNVEDAETFGKVKRMISYILYHLTDFERNAYIAQIKGEMENSEERFENITQALNFVKETVTYGNYQTVFRWANHLCSITDSDKQEIVLMYIKELSNLQFNTYNQFVKWLSNKVSQYQRKFNTIVPKIAAQYLKMNESFSRPIDYLID